MPSVVHVTCDALPFNDRQFDDQQLQIHPVATLASALSMRLMTTSSPHCQLALAGKCVAGEWVGSSNACSFAFDANIAAVLPGRQVSFNLPPNARPRGRFGQLP